MRKFAAAVFAISLPCLLHAQELKITEVPVFGMRADAIAVDAQGIVWAADFVYSTLHRVARDGTWTNFAQGIASERIVIGPDGNIWFNTEEFPGGTAFVGSIGRMTPDGHVDVFRNPLPENIGGFLVAGRDALWMSTDASRLARIGLDGTITDFPFPFDLRITNGVAVDASGNVWVVGSNWRNDRVVEPQVAVLNTNGEWQHWWLPDGMSPMRVVAVGSMIYFGDYAAKAIWRLDPATGSVDRMFGDANWPVALTATNDSIYLVTNSLKQNYLYRLAVDGHVIAATVLPAFSGNALDATIAFSPDSDRTFYVSLADGTDQQARIFRVDQGGSDRRRVVRR